MSKDEFFKFNVGHLIQLVTFIAVASVVYGQLKSDDAHRDSEIAGLKTRLDKIEQAVGDLAVVRNDVSWVKNYLNNQSKRNTND